MPALARADLERLLQDRKLGTVVVAPPVAGVPDERLVASTGLSALDGQLGGGWPRGQVSELVAPLSSGATWVACASLAAATRRGELAALIDPLDVFDPETAASTGFAWPYFLWVRGEAVPRGLPVRGRGRAPARHPSPTRWQVGLERAVKALALVLQTEGFGLVVLDLLEMPPDVVRQLPFTTWRRVQRMVERRDTACVVLHRTAIARSTGGLSLTLGPSADGRVEWRGCSTRSQRLAGLSTRARVIRADWQQSALDGFAWHSAGADDDT